MSGDEICSHCGKTLPAGELPAECPHCGQSLADSPLTGRSICPMCGTPQAEDASRCTHCGEDLNARLVAMQLSLEDRLIRERQAAGLFWTILGMTSLASMMQIVSRPHEMFNSVIGVLTLALLGISGAGFLLFGGLVLARYYWAVHGGLWLSYFCLVSCLFNFNICAAILYLLGVLVGHKVLRKADELGVIRRRVDQTTAKE